MPPNYLSRLQQLDKPWFYRLAWVGGAALFVLAAFLWWQVASVSPERVFWGTVSNNLVTTGVTRHTTGDEQGSKLDQYQHISLGAQNMAVTIATVQQQQEDGAATKVVTETIATPQADFARYTTIETPQKTANDQPFDFTPALNIWSKQELQAGSSGALSEALFGLVPVAYISGTARHKIVSDMQKNKVYTINPKQVTKRHQNGRLIFDYIVDIDPAQYIKTLKQIDAAMGLGHLKDMDDSQYAGSGPVQVKISIDAHAQQLASITYPGDVRTETYSGYGIFNPVALPEQTVPQAVLQAKLNEILGSN